MATTSPSKQLTGADRVKFFDLVDKTGSKNNGERIVARLRLNSFVLKKGEDICKATYNAEKAARLRKRRK
jgi:4-hydroxy-3-methylbut-2-enyl diphosphate reductase IspH